MIHDQYPILGGGNSNIFYVHPYVFGEDFSNLTNIFFNSGLVEKPPTRNRSEKPEYRGDPRRGSRFSSLISKVVSTHRTGTHPEQPFPNRLLKGNLSQLGRGIA